MPNRKELQNKTNRYPGISRTIRQNKRIEAELRDEDTALERTKAFRLGRVKLPVLHVEQIPVVKEVA
jgi:hypothetical protein